jgi:hypothetical protein
MRSINRAIHRFFERFSPRSSEPRLHFNPEPLENRTLLAVLTFPAIADTFVRPNNTSADFGISRNTCALPLSGSGCLVVQNDDGTSSGGFARIAYMKFDPSSVGGNINSAVLRMVGTVANPGTETRSDDLFGVNDTTWIESGPGYMTYATRVPLDGFIGSQAITAPIKAYTWDVFSWIQSHPGQVISLALQMQTQGTQAHYYRSREFGGTAPTPAQLADRPQLVLSVGVPNTPNLLTATPANGSVTLSWGAVDATSYSVYRGTSSGSLTLLQSGLTATNFVDTTVVNGTTYFYHIVATNNSGDSLASNERSATPMVDRVNGPTPVARAGIGNNTLTWEPVPFADSYNVYRSTSPNVAIIPANLLQANVTSPFADTNVLFGTTYYYRMTSVNLAGEGTPGGEVSASPGILGNGTGITGTYYNNVDFTGTSITRLDPTINFNFDLGGPDGTIEADTFSARWLGFVQAQFTQAYTFHTVSDDGVRVWLNDQLIINSWIDQPPTEHSSAPINLVAGEKYHLRVDFYEAFQGAVAQLLWSGAATTKEVISSTQLHADDLVPRKPVAPIEIVPNVVDASLVCLRWTDVSFNETRYVVERSTTPNFAAGTVVNVPLAAGPNVGNCKDNFDPSAPVRWWYRIAAVNDVGTSDYGLGPAEGVLPNGPRVLNFQPFTATSDELVLVNGPQTPPVLPIGPGPELVDGRLRLIRPLDGAYGAAWSKNMKIVNSFTSSFDFQVSQSNGADGFTFVIQNASPTAIGGAGGALGYAGMPRSVAIKFDFYHGPTGGAGIINHTGVYTNGNAAIFNDNVGVTVNSGQEVGGFGIEFDGNPSGTGRVIHVDVSYDGTTLVYTLSDALDRTRTVSLHYDIDIVGTLGSDCAWVGFTAANGGLHAQVEILNFNFNPGTPVVNGTVAPDTFYVRLDQPGGNRVHVWKNRDPVTNPTPDIDVAKADINNLALNGGRGTDTFTIDMTNGDPLPAGGLLVDGGQNSDTLIVKGTPSGESITVNGTHIGLPIGSFRHQGLDVANFNLGENVASDPDDSVTVTSAVGFVPTLNGGGGNNTLSLNGGIYSYTNNLGNGNNDGAGNSTLNVVAGGNTLMNFATSQNLKSLALNDTARAVLVAGGSKVLRTSGLNIAAGASLDLGDGDAIVQSVAKFADWQRLIGYLKIGRNGGLWNGSGIRSSIAGASPTRSTNIGIVLNDAGGGVPILTSFNGQPVDANSILLKYTYYGDRDLDGDIDADDYAAIDDGWANRANPTNMVFPRQPSRHGDIDHSGVIDSDDFFLIDKSFGNQTTVLAPTPAPAASSSTSTKAAVTKKAAAKKMKAKKVVHHKVRMLMRVRD